MTNNKNVIKCAKRMVELASIFAQPRSQWRKEVRGKEKATNNLITRIDGEMGACRTHRREDQLPKLEDLRDTAESFIILLQEAKDRELIQWDLKSMSKVVKKISTFCDDHKGHFLEAQQAAAFHLDPNLTKIQVDWVGKGCVLFWSRGIVESCNFQACMHLCAARSLSGDWMFKAFDLSPLSTPSVDCRKYPAPTE